MAQHTPGPWHVYVDNFSGKIDRYPGIEAKGMTIVLWGEEHEPDLGVQGNTAEESLANAHLIAAAPDLLAACKAFVDSFHDHPDRDEVSLAMARAAIAKAEAR